MTVGKVKNFSFPSHHGFTGSAGKVVRVKPHLRAMPDSGRKIKPLDGPGNVGPPMQVNTNMPAAQSEVTAGFKRGGKIHKDATQDRALIKRMLKHR